MPFRIETDAHLREVLGSDGAAWANSYLRQRQHIDGDAQLHELAAWFDAAIEVGMAAVLGTSTAPRAPAEIGAVTWHSSDEDSGPDIGIAITLRDGSNLYFGEVPRRSWDDAGGTELGFPDDRGWWIVFYPPGAEGVILGRCAETIRHHDGLEELAARIRGGQAPGATAPRAATAEQLLSGLLMATRNFEECLSGALDVWKLVDAYRASADAHLLANGWEPPEQPGDGPTDEQQPF